MKINRCTPFCNTNPHRTSFEHAVKGIGVAVRAGTGKAENEASIYFRAS